MSVYTNGSQLVYTPPMAQTGLVAKTEQIHIRVTAEDKAAIEREAESLGMTVSTYLLFLHRMRLLEQQEGRK